MTTKIVQLMRTKTNTRLQKHETRTPMLSSSTKLQLTLVNTDDEIDKTGQATTQRRRSMLDTSWN